MTSKLLLDEPHHATAKDYSSLWSSERASMRRQKRKVEFEPGELAALQRSGFKSLPLTDIHLHQDEIAFRIGIPFYQWPKRCHEISLAFLKHNIVKGRVARGSCTKVLGQHSWIVVGNDCYAKDAYIVDPTLWSYDIDTKGIWHGYNPGRHAPNRYWPHGHGSIWEWGRPAPLQRGEEQVVLRDGYSGFSIEAREFLDRLGPLGYRGWRTLAHAPVGGWPAKEILTAMYNTPSLQAYIPIDIVGMVTDINPGGLYW